MNKTLIRDNRIAHNELLVDETIFSQANGILGVRGTFCEGYGREDDQPYALINGFYNTYDFHYEENSIHFPQVGQTIIKLPDACTIHVFANGQAVNMSNFDLVDLKREYQFEKGLVYRKAEYRNKDGLQFTLEEERIVSSSIKGLIAIHLKISSKNFEGIIQIQNGITLPNIRTQKHNDPRVAQEIVHLDMISLQQIQDRIEMSVQAKNTGLGLTISLKSSEPLNVVKTATSIRSSVNKTIQKNEVVDFYQYAFYDSNLTNPDHRNVDDMLKNVVYQQLKKEQEDWAKQYWENSSFEISDPKIDIALKYAMYQLNSSGGENEQVQIAAKGISGAGYEGHYFWDTEIYMLPYFILNHPQKAKNILMYRYNHLDAAREEARHLGVNRGVKIPWRTINGLETSPYYPAGSAQVHINSDIAYSVMTYYYATHDINFMKTAGFELLLETAVFLLDYGNFEKGHFHLNTVTGPDEYTALVNDNYYTNSMAKSHFEAVLKLNLEYPSDLSELIKKLGYSHSVLEELNRAALQMTFLEKDHVMAQDEGFFNKKILEMAAIPNENHPMLLHYHPLYIYRHQILKQADVMLSMVLLNHKIDETYRKSYEYYNLRTTHDSSLSKCIYGISSFALGEIETAFKYFEESLFIDLEDERNHSQHGLHMANIGGAYLLLVYGLFGVRLGEPLNLAPIAQGKLKNVKVAFKYLGVRLNLELTSSTLNIVVDKPIRLKVYGEEMLIEHSRLILIKGT